MTVSNAPETTADSGGVPEGLDLGKLGDMEGIREIMEHLQKRDWAAMVGAIMTIWKEYFGTPEEKAEIARARKEAKEGQTRRNTREELGRLREGAEGNDEEQAKGGDPELVKDPELPDGREFVLIGDSVANGMHLSFAAGKRPSFIGKDGMTTFQVLDRLKAEKERLTGKKKAIIYCAGNNILGSSADTLVNHMVAMTQICHEAGVPEIIVNTQFPPVPDYKKNIGEDKFAELIEKNEAFRAALLEAHASGRFPPGVRVVDLTKPFSDEAGGMRADFVDSKDSDYLHPWGAYKPALDYMMQTDRANDSKAV